MSDELVRELGKQALGGAFFITFIVGLLREWWVLGREYRRERADKEEWKKLALSGTKIAELAVEDRQRRREEPP